MPLISRKNHPPGGFTFYQPETKWHLAGGLPFDMAIEAIIRHRTANPTLSLATDPTSVANELDAFTCARLHDDSRWCLKKKTERPPSPLSYHHKRQDVGHAAGRGGLVSRASQVASGVATLSSWIGNGADAVSPLEADRRARICSTCPNNVPGSMVDSVIGGVADAIRSAVSLKAHLDLATQKDDLLGTCDACGCHLPLKVWVPGDEIRKSLTDEVVTELAPQCWMRKV